MVRTVEGKANWKNIRVGIVAAKWNSMITDQMLEGAITALKGKGIPENQIIVVRCPGSYEIPLACKNLLDDMEVDGVVAIGAVIRGETPHFDYVCDAVNKGVTDLNLEYGKPITFGVLTTNTVKQAMKRANIEDGNKGAEAALAMCEMISLGMEIRNQSQEF